MRLAGWHGASAPLLPWRTSVPPAEYIASSLHTVALSAHIDPRAAAPRCKPPAPGLRCCCTASALPANTACLHLYSRGDQKRYARPAASPSAAAIALSPARSSAKSLSDRNSIPPQSRNESDPHPLHTATKPHV